MTRKEFIGRQDDISTLKKVWSRVIEGTPCFFVLRADSGVGKTRLIQQFYHWLSNQKDDKNYWCDSLYDKNKAISIVPEISDRPIKEIPELPWLWLASRCQGTQISSGDAEVEVAFDAVRHQLAIHLAAIFRAQEKKSLNRNVAKASFGLVASFALPGSGQLIEVFNAILEGAGGTLSVADIYNAFKRKIKDIKSDATSLSDVIKKEHGTIIDSSVKAFAALLDRKDKHDIQESTPIILFIDDAHRIDPVTGSVLDKLLDEAKKGQWPILLIIASWDEPLRFKRSRDFNAVLTDLVEKWRIKGESDGFGFFEHELAPLQIHELSTLIRQRIPHLGNEALEVLSRKAGGDIDLLFDFLDEMKQSPGWLTAEGSLEVDPSDLERLPSKAVEMAKRRLNAAGERIRETLTWASAQGYQFDELVVRDLLNRLKKEINASEALLESDTYGFVKTNEHTILSLTGEFRRLVYFDACNEFFERHPNGKTYLTELAHVLRDMLESRIWNDLEADDKLRLGRRFVSLIDGLNLSGSFWKRPLNNLLLELAYLRLQVGDTLSAERYAERLLKARSASAKNKNEARKVLVASAYMEGDVSKESRRLTSWRRSAQGNTLDYYACDSLFAMRQGKLQRSVDMSRKVMALAKTPNEKVEGAISETVALWANGRPDEALEPLKQAEGELHSIDTNKGELETSLRHTSSLVLHDLERNAQVMYHAKRCIDQYEQAADRQQEIISRVNLGDAMWGVGLVEDAEQELKRAYREASELKLAHAQDIAAVCLGNVLQEQGRLEEAEVYYLEGITIAKKIGHFWDQLYGEIYYETLCMRSNYLQGLLRLSELAKLAKREGYGYLSDLAGAMSAIARVNLGRKSVDGQRIARTKREPSISPLARCYFEAERVLGSTKIDSSVTSGFLLALGVCEGIKGQRRFIVQAIDKLEKSGGLTEVEKEFIKRWKGRFVWDYGRLPEEMRVVPCDHKTCEARCCYDGVYLVEDEENKIREVVEDNPDFFAHLPHEYIVEEAWEGVLGIKTAVRNQEYSSPDFPAHFNKTRCVFAFKDGACSLQVFAVKSGKPSWEYKPISCVMHPLFVRGGEVVAPPRLGEGDASFVDVGYPGYASFTPCGQPRSDGRDWREVFGEEIEVWKKRFAEQGRTK